jgi:hypothetical protein
VATMPLWSSLRTTSRGPRCGDLRFAPLPVAHSGPAKRGFDYSPFTDHYSRLTSRGHSLMVKFQPSKLAMRVRFPLPALLPMKKRLFRPPRSPQSERSVRHRLFSSFDSRLRCFSDEKSVKLPPMSENCSERPAPRQKRA